MHRECQSAEGEHGKVETCWWGKRTGNRLRGDVVTTKEVTEAFDNHFQTAKRRLERRHQGEEIQTVGRRQEIRSTGPVTVRRGAMNAFTFGDSDDGLDDRAPLFAQARFQIVK